MNEKEIRIDNDDLELEFIEKLKEVFGDNYEIDIKVEKKIIIHDIY